jgi:L-threonylcarbamoyladenylate synthase
MHYAPATPSFRLERHEKLENLVHRGKLAIIVLGPPLDRALSAAVASFALESPAAASRALYDVLHQCDSLGPDSIVVVMPPDLPEWHAVRDRLLRATRAPAEAQ